MLEKGVPGSHFSKDPAEYSVIELKCWLKCHGEKRSGMKQELINRVQGSMVMKKGIDPKVDGGKWYDLKRRGKELQSLLQVTSIKIPSQGWECFPLVDIPTMFNYGHVYQYFIESIYNVSASVSDSDNDGNCAGGSGYATSGKPLQKGHNLMKSGFVNGIHDSRQEDHYFVIAHVHHSMKNDLPLGVLVVLRNISGSVQHATVEPLLSS